MSVPAKARLSTWAVWSAVAGVITLLNWGYYVLQGHVVPSQPIRPLLRSGISPVAALFLYLAPIVTMGPVTYALGAFARRRLLNANPPESGMSLVAFAVAVGVLGTLSGTVWVLCLLQLGNAIRSM